MQKRNVSSRTRTKTAGKDAGSKKHASSKRTRQKSFPVTSKSPLRYPGGKTQAVKMIMQLITELFPHGIDKICSPFIGGGSIELACAASGIEVYGADGFKHVVEFWNHAIKNPIPLSERVRKYYPLPREKFYSLQRALPEKKDEMERAAIFYVLNRSSFSGTTLSGGMSPDHPRFTQSAIDRLRNLNIKGLQVDHADFTKTLAKHAGKFLYLDPPYANGGNLYGKKGDMHEKFDHEALADILNKRDGWILSYNDCPMIRKLYKRHKVITPQWKYGMNASKSSNEVLIINA